MLNKLTVGFISGLLLIFITAIETFPCRPLKTEDCGTTPVNKPSIEWGIEAENDNQKINTLSVGYVFNLGLTDKMDAGFELPFQQSLNSDGSSKNFGDITIKMKYSLTTETNSQPAFLTKLTVTLPTADKESGLGNGQSDIGALLVLTKSFGNFNVYSNIGYTSPARIKNQDNSNGFLGLGFLQPLNKTINLLWEFTCEPTFNSDNPFDTTLGINHGINENVAWDIAIRKNLNNTGPNYTLITGLTTSF